MSRTNRGGATTVIKRTVNIGGRNTSVSLEDDYWRALNSIARAGKIALGDLVGSIDLERKEGGLSSAIRVWLYRRALGGKEAT